MHSKCGSEPAREDASSPNTNLNQTTAPTLESIPNVGAGLLAKTPSAPIQISTRQLLPHWSPFQMWERACSRRRQQPQYKSQPDNCSHIGVHSKCGSEPAREDASSPNTNLNQTTAPTLESIPNVGASLLAKTPAAPIQISTRQLLPHWSPFHMWERACSRRRQQPYYKFQSGNCSTTIPNRR
jgi:hypothetical protein